MSYLFLFVAITCEVVGTLLLPTTQNFTKPVPTISVLLFYAFSFYCLTYALKTIPLAIAYATWSGLGVFVIALLGYVIYSQILQWQAILGLVLIISGVILVNGYSKLH